MRAPSKHGARRAPTALTHAAHGRLSLDTSKMLLLVLVGTGSSIYRPRHDDGIDESSKDVCPASRERAV